MEAGEASSLIFNQKAAQRLQGGYVGNRLVLITVALLALAGCKDRVIWNDHGEIEQATTDREIWDSNGKMEAGERKIWVNKDGEEVIK